MNVNGKINAKYNFFWGIRWLPLSLPYLFSNLVCLPILCISLQTMLGFLQKNEGVGGRKEKERQL